MLAIIYGTRPEFLKLKILINILRQRQVPLKVIRINQHQHLVEDAGFYDTLLDINTQSADRISAVGSSILINLPAVLEGCTHVLAQGDTATVFYSLLVAFQMGKKVIHLEAGMRTYNLEQPFPEEGFRQMISRITTLHLCPSEREADHLCAERVQPDTIYIVGNTILDLVANYGFVTTKTNNILITLHRRENWAAYDQLLAGIADLATKWPTYTFTFISHPNPALKTKLADFKRANLLIVEPMVHKELISALSACSAVITDSGGIQEEANFLGKPTFVLRQQSERRGTNIYCTSLEALATIDFDKVHGQPDFEYGHGDTCLKIVGLLECELK